MGKMGKEGIRKRAVGVGGRGRLEMYLVVVGRSKYILVEMPIRIGARGAGRDEEAMVVIGR